MFLREIVIINLCSCNVHFKVDQDLRRPSFLGTKFNKVPVLKQQRSLQDTLRAPRVSLTCIHVLFTQPSVQYALLSPMVSLAF